jgi:hypothetical protein
MVKPPLRTKSIGFKVSEDGQSRQRGFQLHSAMLLPLLKRTVWCANHCKRHIR